MFRHFRYLFVLIFVMPFALFSQDIDPTKLSKDEITTIMQQILSEHLGQQEMTVPILRTAFKNYIDDFDPQRIYLLEEDVRPYLQISDSDAKRWLEQYQVSDFSAFANLNSIIQKSITRARNIRSQWPNSLQRLIDKSVNASTAQQESWRDEDQRRLFAVTLDQLKQRMENDFAEFIQEAIKHFGKGILESNPKALLSIYEDRARSLEDPYMGTNAQGQPLSPSEKDSAFTLHILKALAASLDTHTEFFDREEAYEMRIRLEKSFYGIGVAIDHKGNDIIIAELLPNGAAAKSGKIREGDTIVTIDGQSVSDMSLEDVADLLRGEKGTSVSLELKRDDQAITVKLDREVVPVNEGRVTMSAVPFANGVIGEIKIPNFYQSDETNVSTVQDVRDAIAKLQKEGPIKGLILDLRNDGGGFLDQAVDVVSLFISSGVVVVSKYADGEENFYRATEGKALYSGPMVVLVSRTTASAAEIVTQALQDYGVALIIGDERTFGKGTIQSQTVTDSAGLPFFKVTVGEYYTVSGKTPQLKGIKSDILVPGPLNNQAIGERFEETMQISPGPNTINPEYKDDLEGVPSDKKAWYLKYYIPTLQPKVTKWRDMLPLLKKNSEYRIANDRDYQMFLTGKMPEKSEEEEQEEATATEESSEESTVPPQQKNFGADDLQMKEAVNIIKDMLYLQFHQLKLKQGTVQPRALVGALDANAVTTTN